MRTTSFSTLVVLLFFVITQVLAMRSSFTGSMLTGDYCNLAHSACAASCMAKCRHDSNFCSSDCPDQCDCLAFACMCKATGDPYYCDELAC
ncbi:hypothetical protein BJ742DRAFT_811732 [Cladochytrium replicatum]|nr:hypothetical protein BJ742DRAFT_811732 [Cladochytrium replicatum]